MSSLSRLPVPVALLAALVAVPAAHAAAPTPTYDNPRVLGVGVGISDPRSLAAADLDGDGRLDLVAGDANGGAGRVSVLRSTGLGTFGAPLGNPFDPGVVGGGVGPVAVGDVNGDGHPDVVAGFASGVVTDQVAVLEGDGTGRLTAASGGSTTTRANLTGLGLSDLDLDGDLDVLTAHESGLASQQLAVLRQGGSGALSLVNSYGPPSTSMAMDLAVGQLDGQAGADALVVSRNGGAGSAWVAQSAGISFSAGNPVPVGPAPAAVTLADVDDDSDLDGLVLDGSTGLLTVLDNDGAGQLTPSAVSVPGLVAGSGLAAGDLDGDGDVDVVVTDDASDRLGVLLGNRAGGFAAPVWLATGAAPRSPVIADLNGDAVPDLATADAAADALSVRFGTSQPDPRASAPADLGERLPGTTGPPRTITVTNVGAAALRVQGVSIVGINADDVLVSHDDCSATTVRSGGVDACTVNVRFAPSALGVRSASVRVRYAGGGLMDVPLTGTGADPSAAPAATTPTPDTTVPVVEAPALVELAPDTPLPTATPAVKRKRTPLVLTLDKTLLRARAGKKLTVRFALGRAAHVVLRVKRGARTAEILRDDLAEGRGSLTWDGLLGRKAAPPGTYRIAVYAVADDGAVARASATLTIRA